MTRIRLPCKCKWVTRCKYASCVSFDDLVKLVDERIVSNVIFLYLAVRLVPGSVYAPFIDACDAARSMVDNNDLCCPF